MKNFTHLKDEALYPAAVEDTQCAVRYVRAHAEEQ